MDFFKKNNTSRYPTDILIGELFVKAGVISQKQLDDTVRSAGAKHLHIGQMLVMSGFIKQQHLQSAVDLQSLIRDKSIDMAVAARCLKISHKTGADVLELVKEEQNLGQRSNQTNRLGELLMESGLINKGQLAAAMQRSVSTGLPLGRILVLNNSIGDALLRFALDLQVRVRDEMIDRAEAIESLRTEATRLGMKVGYYDVNPNDSTVNLKPLKQKVVKLGELLVSAQFLNETDVMSCLELGLLTERPIGEIMVEQGYISGEMLNVALTVQQMVEERVYTKEEAGEVLAQIRETNVMVPAVQDRIDGRFETGSFSSAETPLGDYEHSYDEQAETIAPGSVARSDYDMSADLQEFNDVVSAPKTGRHSSSRQKVVAQTAEADPDPIITAAPIVHATPASNFEEAPSLESLMAGFGTGQHDAVEPGTLFSDATFNQQPYDSGKTEVVSQTVADQATTADQPGLGADYKPTVKAARATAHPFESLLISAQVVAVEEIDYAFEQARSNPLLLAEILQQTGLLTEVGRTAALDCHNLISNNHFDADQGAQILDHCINQGRLRNLTLEEAMVEMGWSTPTTAAAADAKATETKDVTAPPQSKEGTSSGTAGIDAADIVDSLDAGLGVANADHEPKAEDLLRDLGLTDTATTASDEVLAKSALTGAAAESLMASLQGESPEEAAMTEAASARPEAFQTTAVFKSIADEELDLASSLVPDGGSSLDSLLQRLEGKSEDGSDAANLTDFNADSSKVEALPAVPGADSTVETPAVTASGAASFEPSDTNGHKPVADEIAPGMGALDDASALIERLNVLDANGGTDNVVEDFNKKVTEEVDLRSLFSSLSIESPAKAAAKAAAAAAAKAKDGAAETAAATTNGASGDAAKAAEAGKAAVPSPAPELVPAAVAAAVAAPPELVAASAPAPAPVSPTPAVTDVAPTAPEVVTPPTAPAPVAAVAAVPTPVSVAVSEPVVAAAAPAPVKAKPAASVSNSKLPTMSEAELYAAKTAQIAAMAGALTKMAEMHYEQANYAEAQKAYERILSWRQGELGTHHIDLVDDLNNLAGVMCVQELFDQAEPMIRRAVDILEKAELPEPLRLAENLTSLAGLQFRLGVFAQAEPLLAKSLSLREQEFGPDSTELADPLRDYAKLLKKLGKLEEAEQYYARAKILLARRKAEAAGT